MFNKNDKITKLIEKALDPIQAQIQTKDIDYLEAHFQLQKSIETIYNSNSFCYQDLVKRKNHLTVFNDNLKNVTISTFTGASVTVFFCILNALSNLFYIFAIIGIILSVVALAILVYRNIDIAYSLAELDKFNTKEFELNIIDNGLENFEKDYEKYKKSCL